MNYVLAMQVMFFYILANLLGVSGGSLAVILLTKRFGVGAGLAGWGGYVLLVVLMTAGYSAFLTQHEGSKAFWDCFWGWGAFAVPLAAVTGGMACLAALLIWRRKARS